MLEKAAHYRARVFPGKLEVVRQAVGVLSNLELARRLIPDRAVAGVPRKVRGRTAADRLADNLDNWEDGAVRMRNLRFFEVLAAARLGDPPARLFAENVNASALDRCSIRGLTELLTEGFRRNVNLEEILAREGPQDVPPPDGGKDAELSQPFSLAKVYPHWNDFWTILDRAKPKPEEKTGDLRIMTTSFTNGAVPRDELLRLCLEGVHIRIILTDPRSALIEARQRLRSKEGSWSPRQERRSLREQITTLKDMRTWIKAKRCRGRVDFRLSSLMPHSFLARGPSFAVMGLFFADRSYHQGPMHLLDGPDNLTYLSYLAEEWDKRWGDARREP